MSAEYYAYVSDTKEGQLKLNPMMEAHRGLIKHVDNRCVYLQPLDCKRNLGGFGYGFYGPGFSYDGFDYGLALGAIGTLALLPLFYW